jgi:uncharacterized protein (DUF1697 family)
MPVIASPRRPKMSATPFAVLLRGVNVGGRNKVPMARLRELLAARGYADVTTLLQSGNVLLQADADGPEVAAEVHRIVADEFGVDSACVAVDRDDLRCAIDECPLTEKMTDPARLAVFFLSGPITPERLAAWDPREDAPVDTAIGTKAVYQWVPEGLHTAPQILPLIERRWQLTGTARNWRTVTRLADLMDQRETR